MGSSIVEPTQSELLATKPYSNDNADDLVRVDIEPNITLEYYGLFRYVFYRKSDETYWAVDHRVDEYGEGLERGYYSIKQVYPQERIIVIYRTQEEVQNDDIW